MLAKSCIERVSSPTTEESRRQPTKKRKRPQATSSNRRQSERIAERERKKRPNIQITPEDTSCAPHQRTPTLLVRHNKAAVIDRLVHWFPAIAQRFRSIERYRTNPRLTLFDVQRVFWQLMCEYQDDDPFAFILKDAMQPCGGMPERGKWPRPTPRELLYGLVFNSHITNPVWGVNERIERVHMKRLSYEKQPRVFRRSIGFVPTPEGLAQTVQELAGDVEAFLADDFSRSELQLYYHGTDGAAIHGIANGGVLNPTQKEDPHDFGRALYTFLEQPYWAAAWAVDRVMLRPEKDEPRKLRSSVVLLAIALPVDYVKAHEVSVDQVKLSSEERVFLRQEMIDTLQKTETETDRYLDRLDNWQSLVKFSRIVLKAPRVVGNNSPIFHGDLHHCDKTGSTDRCNPPERDPDDWTQDAITFEGDDAFNKLPAEAVFVILELKPDYNLPEVKDDAILGDGNFYTLQDFEESLQVFEERRKKSAFSA